MLVAVVALCDTISSFALIAGLPADQLYLVTLTLKIAIAFFATLRRPGDAPRFVLFISVISLFILISAYTSEDGYTTIRLGAYAAHMTLTYFLVQRIHFASYIGYCAKALTAYGAVYMCLYFFGYINSVSGRYFYFNNSHPNLGGESLMMAVPLAALSLRPRWVATATIMTVPPILLMQARAALLVVLLALPLYVFQALEREKRGRGWWFVTISLTCLLMVSVALPEFFFGVLDSAFKITDQYRGEGTGFVGRAGRWDTALRLFTDNPIFGVGLNYFDARDFEAPHNFFLYSLASFGIFGLIPIAALAAGYWKLARSNSTLGLALIGTSVALFFNDRFLNLNVYPFVLQFLLLAYPQQVKTEPE